MLLSLSFLHTFVCPHSQISFPLFVPFPCEQSLFCFSECSGVSQTSVCRSMISWPTRGMVALAFSHSTVCISRGEACRGSSSLRTHDGGEWVFLMPSHARLLGVCCLSCIYKNNNILGRIFCQISSSVQIRLSKVQPHYTCLSAAYEAIDLDEN